MESELIKIESQADLDKRLKSIFVWAMMFFIFAIITGFFNLIASYRQIILYSEISSVYDPFKYRTIGYIIIGVLHAVVFPTQAYLFYRFISIFKNAIPNNDLKRLNLSLIWLLRQTIIAAIFFGLNSLWAIISSILV